MRSATLFIFAAFICALWNLPAQADITIMPLGDSGTVGEDNYTLTAAGYRDPLWRDLVASGISFTFVGAANNTNNFGSATRPLKAAGEDSFNGFGGYEIIDIFNNLDGDVPSQVTGTGNQGGFWLTGGGNTRRGAVTPDIILLAIGYNDVFNGTPLPKMKTEINDLVVKIHKLTPHTTIIVAGMSPPSDANFLPTVLAFNSYVQNTVVPAYAYTRFVDNYSALANPDGTVNGLLLGSDHKHLDRYGYPIFGTNWAAAIQAVEGSKPKLYDLTVTSGIVVNNGKSNGSYPAGTVLTLSSDAPPGGSQFSRWSTSGPTTALNNLYWPQATYIMPATNATVTANYTKAGTPAIPDGTYNIVLGSDSYRFAWSINPSGLSVTAAGVDSGSQVQQQTYTGAATQQWVLHNLGNNVVELSLPGTSNALSVAGDATATKAPLEVEAYTGAANQQWTVSSLRGATQLVNVKSGQSIYDDYSTSSGSQLMQQNTGFMVNGAFAFYPVASEGTTDAAKGQQRQ